MKKTRSNTPQKALNQSKQHTTDSSFHRTRARMGVDTSYNKENNINNSKIGNTPTFTDSRSAHGRKTSAVLNCIDHNVQPFNHTLSNMKKKPVKSRSNSVCRPASTTGLEGYDSYKQNYPRYKTPNRDQQGDSEDYKIHSKIGSLQKSIDSQEKTLKSMQKKLKIEKSELTEIVDKVSRTRAPVNDSTAAVFYHTDDFDSSFSRVENLFPPRYATTVPRTSHSESTVQDAAADHNLSEELPPRKSAVQPPSGHARRASSPSVEQLSKQLVNLQEDVARRYSNTSQNFSRKSEDNGGYAALEAKYQESLKENKTLRLKVEDHKSYIRTAEDKHELELKDLKQQLDRLAEENFKLRCKQANSKEDVFQKMEQMYKSKIGALEEQLQSRGQDKTDQSEYRNQLEEINRKMMKLQGEMQKNAQLEERVKGLNLQLSEKENQLQAMKKHYVEKLQIKIDDQVKQKKEWSRVYGELLSEIRTLKGEIDMLSDNKRAGHQVAGYGRGGGEPLGEFNSNRHQFL